MGTKCAPHFANIFMSDLEQNALLGFHKDLVMWVRFIDDIFGIFIGPKERLDQLIHRINNMHPNIKLTFDVSHTSVNFLDTTIYFDQQHNLQSRIYRKPTNANLILHYHSNHPHHIKRNIVYNETLRYHMITSEDHTYWQRKSNSSKEYFLPVDIPAH